MTQPSDAEIAVAVESLRTEARVWDRQGESIGALAPRADQLRLTRLEAGIFQLVVSPYEAVVDQVTARCREGEQRMREIASTLVHVAQTYEDEDQRSEHRFRGLY